MSMLEVASIYLTDSLYSSELDLPKNNYVVQSPSTREQGPIRLTPSMIPSCSDYEIEDSSFFSSWDKLPTPEEVRSQAYIQYTSGMNLDKRKTFSVTDPHVAPPPVLFKDMGLFVKWGTSARISEAQTLYAIRHVLNGAVPVPEVYGWKTQGDEKFIYMEYIPGQSLESAWSTLEQDDRLIICQELRTICDNLRRLEQNPSDNFVGKLVLILVIYNLKMSCVISDMSIQEVSNDLRYMIEHYITHICRRLVRLIQFVIFTSGLLFFPGDECLIHIPFLSNLFAMNYLTNVTLSLPMATFIQVTS